MAHHTLFLLNRFSGIDMPNNNIYFAKGQVHHQKGQTCMPNVLQNRELGLAVHLLTRVGTLTRA